MDVEQLRVMQSALRIAESAIAGDDTPMGIVINRRIIGLLACVGEALGQMLVS